MKLFATALLAGVFSFAASDTAAQAQTIDDLAWQHGPAVGTLGAQATVKVPEGYVFLAPDGARELNRLTQNPDPGVDEYVLAKDDLSWVAYFSYEDVGYVKDDEKLDSADLLATTTEGTEASNEERRANGWPALHVKGWAFEPQYDKTINSLEWAFRLRGEGSNSDTINYNTRLLGRSGVMNVLLVTGDEELQASVADFKRTLPGYAFNAGQTYAEFREGDRIAEYGLAALVTGGAAAVASKKGFFAMLGVFFLKFWKLALAGMVAVGMGARSLFGKKKTDGAA
ncbi:DUF2167 domain-containing protein [Cognatilysobacter bugurensis]|uniref:Membrane protein n=1 Tax=Cognatilysobacter bugurensis TaxID=543356 RepID=A0A918SV34_9GAMM|nr:DUF2167 domain-containing protein [Lysobacter bugurensis]GHA72827.1 membrane protein [Lysobacter bugurensis]